MEEIELFSGLFFGKAIYMKVSKEDKFDYVKAFQNWIESEKRQAVEDYKSFLRRP